MRTENNIPNAKVVAGVIGAILFGWMNYLTTKYLGFGLPPGLSETIGGLAGGIVGYIIPPVEGDGIIKE